MELLLTRKYFTDQSTIGELSYNGERVCFILEDTDRGLDSTQSVPFIESKKVFGRTAIPTGSYEIIISYSNRFKKPLPLLLNVKGFTGIRIHAGNVASDSEGCLLPGTDHDVDRVNNSRVAFLDLSNLITKAMETEKVFITIVRKHP